jgi:hypothetical protein
MRSIGISVFSTALFDIFNTSLALMLSLFFCRQKFTAASLPEARHNTAKSNK